MLRTFLNYVNKNNYVNQNLAKNKEKDRSISCRTRRHSRGEMIHVNKIKIY